jgi:thioredoxin
MVVVVGALLRELPGDETTWRTRGGAYRRQALDEVTACEYAAHKRDVTVEEQTGRIGLSGSNSFARKKLCSVPHLQEDASGKHDNSGDHLWAVISFAADRVPFDQNAFEAAQAAGKSILVDVSAPWCPVCRAQKPIIEKLSLAPEYKDLTIFDVDFDTQKDVLRNLQVQRQSTLIVFRGAKEIDRSVGSTDPSAISDLLKKAI